MRIGKRILRKTENVLAGTTERVIDFAGLAKIRPDDGPDGDGDGNPDGVMTFRLPVGGTTAVEEARALEGADRVMSESGYVHSDIRSSILAKTSYQGPALLDKEAEYSAWGETRSVSQNPAPTHQFVDTEPDPATGYYYFGARVYDPTLKRWLSSDPLIHGAPEVEVGDGRELNLYSYSSNNPVKKVDPDGLQDQMVTSMPDTGICSTEGQDAG